jgi:acetate kinase
MQPGKPMPENILLTFNAGSSSLKLGVFRTDRCQAKAIGVGKIDFGETPLVLEYTINGHRFEKSLTGDNDENFVSVIEETLGHLLGHITGDLTGVAHRVVHGGMVFTKACRLDCETIRQIEKLVPLAPLHQPQALRAIDALRRLRPELAQTASFDTAFHASQSDLVKRLAIPRAMHDEGVRRYGFHGLSYKFIASKLKQVAPEVAGRKIVVAHLGSGASLCAIDHGTSIDTSMGFSALDGVPMATRPGWIDPGAIIHMMRNGIANPDQLEDFLYHQCGLKGVSGISGDTRVLLEDRRKEAAEAIDLFCLRIAGETGRLCASLGGLDAFVFTAGIGENQPEIRSRIAQRLAWLGLELEETANTRNETLISTPSSRIKVYVIPTDEERVLADEAMALIE